MNNLLPLVYLGILFTCLCAILIFLLNQIIKKKELETEFLTLQEKLRSGKSSYFDHYSLGVIYLSKKLFDQAIVQFSYSLNNWDKSDKDGLANLYNTIGFTYFESGQFDISSYYYKEAISILPNYITALNNLAYSYEKQKMIEDAINTYSKVLTYDRENPIANEKLNSLLKRFKTRDDRI